MCLLDTIDFPVVFLGAIKAGLVPVAVNTLFTGDDFDFMLRDSRAQALIVSEALLPVFKPILGEQPFLKHIVIAGTNGSAHPRLSDLMASAATDFAVAPTRPDDACFWLYSSGSTGTPKGVVHVQTSLMRTAELYAQPILGIEETRCCLFRGKTVLCLWLGECPDLSALGGRHHHPAQRPANSAGGLPRAARASADDFLWRADAL